MLQWIYMHTYTYGKDEDEEKKSGNEIKKLRMTRYEVHSIMEMKFSFIPNFPYFSLFFIILFSQFSYRANDLL